MADILPKSDLLQELTQYRLSLNPRNLWTGSCFEWLAAMPPAERNKTGEKLVAGWLATKGFDVVRSLTARLTDWSMANGPKSSSPLSGTVGSSSFSSCGTRTTVSSFVSD